LELPWPQKPSTKGAFLLLMSEKKKRKQIKENLVLVFGSILDIYYWGGL